MKVSNVINSIESRIAIFNSATYINYLRKKGVEIGTGCTIYAPKTQIIDLTRPELLTIGNDVKISAQCIILTHGFEWSVLRELHPGELFGSAGAVTIGNNVFIGARVMILKNVEVGDNCVIGAGSVVTKNVSPNSVFAGNPAKFIMTIDDLYAKYLKREIDEAKNYAIAFFKRRNRLPQVSDFKEFFYLFTSTDDAERAGIDIMRQTTNKHYQNFKNSHKPQFKSFQEFLEFCGLV